MQTRLESLKSQIVQAAAAIEPVIDGLGNRPVFLMGIASDLGAIYAQAIVNACKGIVAAVTDAPGDLAIGDLPRWGSEEFLSRAAGYPDAVALDFTSGVNGRGWAAMLCQQAGISRRDCVVAQAQLGLSAVYETATIYRQRTIDRLDDFLRLTDRFDDDLSRLTLLGNLLFRLTYDRDHIIRSSAADEYFSPWADASTFHLGTREHYVDCGAYQGPIVQKFLGATGYRYQSITAFEPDRRNFEKLRTVVPHPIHDFRVINKAVSSDRKMMRFMETGTVSSHIRDDGDTEVEAVRLDDEVDRLTFLKMDIEGFETDALNGARQLLISQRPRAAVCVYHYAHCLLRVLEQFDSSVEDYHFRLRHHFGGYYYDLVLYASPVSGTGPAENAA